MAKVTGGDKFDKVLKEISEQLGGDRVLRVGFLENATYPDGTSVALVAAIQNYGAPSRNIPPRPFFSNMVKDKSEGWPAAIALNLKETEYDVDKTMQLVGEGIAGQLRQSIIDTNFPPLAESTIARKGFPKPLVDTGHMLNSIDFEVKPK